LSAKRPIADGVALATPSHRGDLERVALLVETIDRRVQGYTLHYLIVHDEDLRLFQRFASARRVVLPFSEFLPRWLRRAPLVRWRGRRYYWSTRAAPISGWHAQQLVKIEAAARIPEARACFVDSDNAFFADFDARTLAPPRPVPLRVRPKAIVDPRSRHASWTNSARRVLGLVLAPVPADDFIDQIVVWDRETVSAMIARIERVTGKPWAQALCRERDFSEYSIYGAFVAHDPRARAVHSLTSEGLCRSHWDATRLDVSGVARLIGSATPGQVAICVQSFGDTPLEAIRTTLAAYEAGTLTPLRGARQREGVLRGPPPL